jgi:putative acetyltransferase
VVNPGGIIIRFERRDDISAIHAVQAAAFGQDIEANLVDALRESGSRRISLVAERNGEVVGHVLFSPVSLEGTTGGLGLAPVGVLPEYQGQGIGSALIRAGLDECEKLGAPFVVVLGEPAYYSRFGFKRAKDFGLDNVYGADEEFRVIVYGDAPPPGLVRYGPEFDAVV